MGFKGSTHSLNTAQGGNRGVLLLRPGEMWASLLLLQPPQRASKLLLCAYQSICSASDHTQRAGTPKSIGWKNSHNIPPLTSEHCTHKCTHSSHTCTYKCTYAPHKCAYTQRKKLKSTDIKSWNNFTKFEKNMFKPKSQVRWILCPGHSPFLQNQPHVLAKILDCLPSIWSIILAEAFFKGISQPCFEIAWQCAAWLISFTLALTLSSHQFFVSELKSKLKIVSNVVKFLWAIN